MAGRGKGPDFVEALARGLDILAAFGVDHRGMSLSEVAAAAGLTRPTARRLLLTLEELGFVRFSGGTFELTPKVMNLGMAYVSSLGLWDIARPHMEALVTRTGESSSMAQLDGSDIWQTRASLSTTSGRWKVEARTGLRVPDDAALPYTVPTDGPVGRYLDGVGQHPWRPRTSTQVSARHRTLVTQVFFPDPYLENDTIGGGQAALCARSSPRATTWSARSTSCCGRPLELLRELLARRGAGSPRSSTARPRGRCGVAELGEHAGRGSRTRR